MARMKFLCDAERCIECNGCVTACKNEHEVPWGINRRRVVTVNDGQEGAEKSMSVACMHCSDAPCMAVCPVDCFYKTDDGVVLHDKDLCIGCGYCFYACPFGAPQFPASNASTPGGKSSDWFGARGKMDKCTFCAGGPEENGSDAEFEKYGRNRFVRRQIAGCVQKCVRPKHCSVVTATCSQIYIASAYWFAAKARKCGAGAPPMASLITMSARRSNSREADACVDSATCRGYVGGLR